MTSFLGAAPEGFVKAITVLESLPVTECTRLVRFTVIPKGLHASSLGPCSGVFPFSPQASSVLDALAASPSALAGTVRSTASCGSHVAIMSSEVREV